MLTPQEVSARSFTKMVMGGYNMTMVDEFLDELTEDYTALYKENASLKAKNKVLVEKVEEYRATEESMRATLLTAQRMADSLVKEAEAKRDEMLKQAEAAAREKLEGFRKEAEESDKRLRRGQEDFQAFIAKARAFCLEEIERLDQLPVMELESEEEIRVEEIEEKILASEAAAVQTPAAAAAPAAQPQAAAAAPAAAVRAPASAIPAPATPVPPPSAEDLLDTLAAAEAKASSAPAEDLSATRRVNINDLKFGPNYRGETN